MRQASDKEMRQACDKEMRQACDKEMREKNNAMEEWEKNIKEVEGREQSLPYAVPHMTSYFRQ